MNTDTIAAIATALSNAGLSIIRISGSDALSIIDKIYQSKSGKKVLSQQESHTVHYGYIVDNDQIIDEVMVLVLKAPNTYTREDIVEIDCHGGVIVTKKILETVIKYGARPAEPGEFTKRAFLNGRIDLSQAEAVIDIIHAKSEYALASSVKQLKGGILDKVITVRESILRDIAFIEAALDDPEHISLEHFSEELSEHVENDLDSLNKLLSSAENGRLLKEGVRTVILGKPNAGKSSLLNVLVGEDRAIVTDIAGTTRDTLEETINLHGVILNIIDTAGIRETEDIVEKIGVEKAKQSADNADLIIYVIDGTKELDESDRNIIQFIQDRKAVVLINKTDLETVVDSATIEQLTGKKVFAISAKGNTGIEEFSHYIKDLFFEGKLSYNDEVYITNIRHKTAILEAKDSLEQVKTSIENQMPEDFYSIDLMNAYEKLGEIIGESVGEDLVNMIFKEFCMGK